jgi:TonB-dependent SusC/RagA subfamily outer membrane receptor
LKTTTKASNMPALLIYLLKANIALALFFLAYRWGLRRLTFYVLNRFFLLTAIVCSSVFPLVDVNALLERNRRIEGVVEYVPDFSVLQAQPDPGFTVWQLLVYVFWAGVAVMAIRFVIQLCSLWRIHRRSRTGMLQQQPVKVLPDAMTPFSFFRHIYINPSLHQPAELDAILQHELVHIREWHTVDVIMAELNNIFYWFNPGAWLMRIAIRENLEFITDRRMLRQGADPKAYQYNLIKVSGIPSATAIANNFNFSHLKNRIKMMNKKSSARYNLLRYLVLGCVVVIALLSLNFSRAAFNSRRLAFTQDTIPAPVPPVKAAGDVFVAVPAAPAVPPAPAKISGDHFATVPAMPPVPAAPDAPPAPPAPPTITLDTVPSPPPPPPPVVTKISDPLVGLVVVDGVKKGRNLRLSNIVPVKDIELMSVWKGEEAIKRYGQEGKDGVVEIITRKGAGSGNEIKIIGYGSDTVKVRKSTTIKSNKEERENANENANTDTYKGTNANVRVVNAISLKGSDSSRQPIYVIDGKVTNAASLHAMPPNSISSINVLKGDAASIYGEKGVNGVIIVNTKKDTISIK